jgi:maleylacetate reductase
VTGGFVYSALPMGVRFGAGSLARLPEEVAARRLSRVLLLCSPEQAGTG